MKLGVVLPFLHCKIASQVWSNRYKWWGVYTAAASNVREAFDQHEGLMLDGKIQIGWEPIRSYMESSLFLVSQQREDLSQQLEGLPLFNFSNNWVAIDTALSPNYEKEFLSLRSHQSPPTSTAWSGEVEDVSSPSSTHPAKGKSSSHSHVPLSLSSPCFLSKVTEVEGGPEIQVVNQTGF
ncbi:hypothetical protein SLEP1_g54765 [Rubroshorea leprosula]|uniref:Uncharacterized protein n=1 Tax=Rubroshorea leprosula TaxID=152421 RepID=A0AAV5MDQ4_9ROSI|nr:hypothetical protein SLEP1_g54765 [Rubroshorea leprosula]